MITLSGCSIYPGQYQAEMMKMKERSVGLSGIPYVKGRPISEVLAITSKDHGVDLDMYDKPINTLKSQLVHPKYKVDKTKVSDAIYYINVLSVGETDRDRSFIIRWKEHNKREKSAVHQNC